MPLGIIVGVAAAGLAIAALSEKKAISSNGGVVDHAPPPTVTKEGVVTVIGTGGVQDATVKHQEGGAMTVIPGPDTVGGKHAPDTGSGPGGPASGQPENIVTGQMGGASVDPAFNRKPGPIQSPPPPPMRRTAYVATAGLTKSQIGDRIMDAGRTNKGALVY